VLLIRSTFRFPLVSLRLHLLDLSSLFCISRVRLCWLPPQARCSSLGFSGASTRLFQGVFFLTSLGSRFELMSSGRSRGLPLFLIHFFACELCPSSLSFPLCGPQRTAAFVAYLKTTVVPDYSSDDSVADLPLFAVPVSLPDLSGLGSARS